MGARWHRHKHTAGTDVPHRSPGCAGQIPGPWRSHWLGKKIPAPSSSTWQRGPWRPLEFPEILGIKCSQDCPPRTGGAPAAVTPVPYPVLSQARVPGVPPYGTGEALLAITPVPYPAIAYPVQFLEPGIVPYPAIPYPVQLRMPGRQPSWHYTLQLPNIIKLCSVQFTVYSVV